MRRVVNKRSSTGAVEVEIVTSIWSDHHLREFMDICDRLKLGHQSVVDDLTPENELEFIKAFYPSFDTEKQLAVIHPEKHQGNGFMVYLIEVWERCD